MPTTYMTVEVGDVEMYLKAGWVVILPGLATTHNIL
jgi:hypothetical protein